MRLALRRASDAKLAALANDPDFAGVPRRRLATLGMVIDLEEVRAGTIMAERGRRILQPMVVTDGQVAVDDAARTNVVVGMRLDDPARMATATVVAISELRAWLVEPRAVRWLLEMAPQLRHREIAL